MILALAGARDVDAMAAMHARSFETAWNADAIAALLAMPGGYALVARAASEPAIRGFLLARAVAGEAEVLTLAVDPLHRRRGMGHALIEAAVVAAVAAGAREMFLEVAADNIPAYSLYTASGFALVGRRPRYYPGGGDALVLRRSL